MLETVDFIAESRPNPKHEIEQYFMKPESLKEQISLCKILNRKKILFLGDGDHLSLVLGKYLDIEAIVLDVDNEIIESQKRISQKIGLRNHTILHYDVSYPIDTVVDHSFDAFVVNPPYGSKNEWFGAKVWTSRASSVLRLGGTGLSILPLNFEYDWCMKNMMNYQSFISDLGLCLFRIDHNIHTYFDTVKHPYLSSSNIWTYKVEEKLDKFGVISQNLYR